MAEESFRIRIEDAQSSESDKISKEESIKPGLPKSDLSSNKNKSTYSANIVNKSSTDTSVELASKSSDNNNDVSGSTLNVNADVSIYSEGPVNIYGITPAQAEYAEMVARLGDAYSSLFNIEGSDALNSLANDLSKLHNGIDEAKMDTLSKGIMYESLKELLSDLDANKSEDLSINNKSMYERKSDNNSGSSAVAIDNNNSFSNIPIDPYSNILDTVDNEIDKIRNNQTDYNSKKDLADRLEPNLGDDNYSKINDVTDVLKSGTGKWDLRAMPDAMSNMYDVYFRICDNDTDVDGEHLAPSLDGIENLFSSKLLSARITSIDIPAYERTTAQISAWGTSIERPTDKINTPGQSSFSIRGDTRLIYVDFMNILSGTTMADYLGIGPALFDKVDSFSVPRTALFIEDINGKIKEVQDEFDEKLKEIEKENEAEVNNVKFAIAAEFAATFAEVDKWHKRDYTISEKARKEGISISQASYEVMEEDRANLLNNLNAQLYKIEHEKPKEGDNYWAFKKEQRRKRQTTKEIIKEIEKNNKEANKRIEKTLKECAKKIKSLERERNKAVVAAVFTTRIDIPTIEASNVEAAAYVTGSIARNMSVKFSGAPFKSIDDLPNHKRIDIIVKRVSPSKTFKTMLTPKKDERFIFEDVKLLGASDPIAFTRESAETKDFTYQFIYKRFYKLDYYSDNAEDWVMSQLNDLANMATNFAIDKAKEYSQMGTDLIKSLQ